MKAGRRKFTVAVSRKIEIDGHLCSPKCAGLEWMGRCSIFGVHVGYPEGSKCWHRCLQCIEATKKAMARKNPLNRKLRSEA
jgi:hypothetical protein